MIGYKTTAIKDFQAALCFEKIEVLYKYTRSEYVKGILEQGIFKIGTLSEYQEFEGNEEINDPNEGILQFQFSTYDEFLKIPEKEVKKIFRNHSENLEEDYYKFKKKLEAEAEINSGFCNVPIGIQIQAPDQYMFCASKVFDEKAMMAFECDSCIEIQKPHLFFQEISKAIYQYSHFGIMESCVYGDKFGLDSSHTAKPQKVKEEIYKHQQEVRMSWDPRPEYLRIKLEPKIISRPQIAKLCRRIF